MTATHGSFDKFAVVMYHRPTGGTMLAYALIVLGLVFRLIPHMPNYAPIAAIALFAGAYLNKKTVPWVPLAIMVASDVVIGLHDVVLYTWGAFILIGFLGMFLRSRRTPLTVAGMTVFSSLVFFVITNFGVWLAWYPHTAAGLADCYVKALPFLRNDLAGNLVFALIMFGSYELVARTVSAPKLRALLIAK